jgi:hypothetical protein
LKRPFEAKEGDGAGYTGHHKTCLVASKSYQYRQHHVPWGFTRHRDPPSKSPAVFVLRPIERARSWRTGGVPQIFTMLAEVIVSGHFPESLIREYNGITYLS